MKLVPDARNVHKWHSTQIAAVLAAFPYAWEQMPPEWTEQVSGGWLVLISALLFVGFLIGRVRQQDL